MTNIRNAVTICGNIVLLYPKGRQFNTVIERDSRNIHTPHIVKGIKTQLDSNHLWNLEKPQTTSITHSCCKIDIKLLHLDDSGFPCGLRKSRPWLMCENRFALEVRIRSPPKDPSDKKKGYLVSKAPNLYAALVCIDLSIYLCIYLSIYLSIMHCKIDMSYCILDIWCMV